MALAHVPGLDPADLRDAVAVAIARLVSSGQDVDDWMLDQFAEFDAEVESGHGQRPDNVTVMAPRGAAFGL
jgi:hypothetical protein